MNILLLSEDVRLAEALERLGGFHKCYVLGEAALAAEPPEELLASVGAVVVSERLLDIGPVLALRDKCEEKPVFFLMGNRQNTQELSRLRGLCAAHDIHSILPYRTVGQICSEVQRICSKESLPQSKVIAMLGALPQLGLTTSLLHTAVRLSERTGLRVGVLGMNGWNAGDSGLLYEGKYLDDLWGSLQGRQLTEEELPDKMHPLGAKARFLAGSRDLKKLYYYGAEGAAHLIECARRCFDLVLVDAGSYPDHALAAQSLIMSDLVLVHLSQSLQAREQWQRMREQILDPVLGFEPSRALLVLNRMKPLSGLENERQLARQTGIPVLGILPESEELQLKEAERSILRAAPPGYAAEVDKLCRAIIRYYELSEQGTESAAQSAVRTGGLAGAWWRRRLMAFGLKGALGK
ncbi:hypothetical protein O9H85_22530 [Paenibacillus filicis]|uniref:Flp pilus assembly protein, ATPase CpaE n=1 Tax=Paenibacillus gyeongsangnamensis TaxID=3388067 RepID=A0ABT4QE62_9BACL|nr:hypothetical protein [Paenibacillus filicis]MCZ8515144.1 hypothetical protein [Paenibacillus filicis]